MFCNTVTSPFNPSCDHLVPYMPSCGLLEINNRCFVNCEGGTCEDIESHSRFNIGLTVNYCHVLNGFDFSFSF